MMSQALLAPIGPPGLFIRLPSCSFLSIARGILHQEGLRGFFRGLCPTFLRAFPSNASAFFVYEGIMRGLGSEKVNCSAAFGAMFILLNSRSDSALIKLSNLYFAMNMPIFTS